MRAWIFFSRVFHACVDLFFTRFSCVRGFFHAFFIGVSRVRGFCVDFFFTPLVVPF